MRSPAETNLRAAPQGLDIREVGVDVVRPLRRLVLRPGRAVDTVHTPRDEDPNTWHLAAYDGDRVVGVVTLFPDATAESGDRRAERFRWMAVHPDWQSRGVGTLLMRHAAQRLRSRGVEVMWAYGRDSALGFYERIGFETLGEGFIDPDTGIGHHVVATDVEHLLRHGGVSAGGLGGVPPSDEGPG